MDIPLLLVIAAIGGASLNIIRGAANSSDPFSYKKTIGGLITAVVASLGAVVVFDVSSLGGPVQTVLLGLLVGFASDFTTSKLKK